MCLTSDLRTFQRVGLDIVSKGYIILIKGSLLLGLCSLSLDTCTPHVANTVAMSEVVPLFVCKQYDPCRMSPDG